MATLAELRSLVRKCGTKCKTTKRREDGVSLSVKGIAAEPTPAAIAELATKEGATVSFAYEDGTKESGVVFSEAGRLAVLGVYNAEPVPEATEPAPTPEASEAPAEPVNRIANVEPSTNGNGRARKSK